MTNARYGFALVFAVCLADGVPLEREATAADQCTLESVPEVFFDETMTMRLPKGLQVHQVAQGYASLHNATCGPGDIIAAHINMTASGTSPAAILTALNYAPLALQEVERGFEVDLGNQHAWLGLREQDDLYYAVYVTRTDDWDELAPTLRNSTATMRLLAP
jgi:hypothetical protein